SGTARSPQFPRFGPDYYVDGMTVGINWLTLTYVVIPANQTYAVVTVTPIDDAFVEGRETAIFTVLPDANYEVGTPASAVLTIRDNEGGSILGNVFNDANASTAKDEGEPGLTNRRVYIDANNNKAFDAGEPSALTDNLGNYQ